MDSTWRVFHGLWTNTLPVKLTRTVRMVPGTIGNVSAKPGKDEDVNDAVIIVLECIISESE